MKKIFIFMAMFFFVGNIFAQVTAPEPEFVNSYNILTSDSTFEELPREMGELQEHQNKVSKWGKLIGGAANIVGAAGAIGAGVSGSMDGLMTGARVVTTASGVGSAAGTVSALAGAEGMDIVFKGANSTYTVKKGENIRLLIKGDDNERDPMEQYRIVRFEKTKKDRRVQWMEYKPALIGSPKAKKAGYMPFTGQKYGQQSYILTIPASEVEKGEYGIFIVHVLTATYIPIGTFSVK